jgi:hypothetical protein
MGLTAFREDREVLGRMPFEMAAAVQVRREPAREAAEVPADSEEPVQMGPPGLERARVRVPAGVEGLPEQSADVVVQARRARTETTDCVESMLRRRCCTLVRCRTPVTRELLASMALPARMDSAVGAVAAVEET